MNNREYNFHSLSIGIREEKKVKYFRLEDSNLSLKDIEFIKRSIDEEIIYSIEAVYDHDSNYISVFSEKGLSSIVIGEYDEYNKCDRSYSYINNNYPNDEEMIGIAGYDIPKMGVCEDKDLLLKIILYFLKFGNRYKEVDWYEGT